MRDEVAEAEHFARVFTAFEQYAHCSFRRFHRHEQDLNRVPERFRELLVKVLELESKLVSIRSAVLQNHLFFRSVLIHADPFITEHAESSLDARGDEACSEHFADKVRSTLRTVARDWTCEGESERAQCYGPILDALERYFPDVEKRKSIHVLNPGCGLGRLPWEIAMRGFSCQGNEFSYFMLLVSHYILNYASNVPSASEEESKQHKIFPFIHQTTNVFKASDQIRSCSVPDVNPNDVALKDVDFSMTAGDWLEVYRDPEQPKRDVVVTCFFIDTAKNVLEFLEVISLILKDGGLWINLGPLLYHYADMENELSIELAYDEIKRLFPHFGFDILEEKSALECNYTWNKESMLKMAYKCVFSVCRKTSKKEEC